MRRPLFWTGMVFLSSTAAFLRLPIWAAAAACAGIVALACLFSGGRPKRAAALFSCAAAAALLWLSIWTSVFLWRISPVAGREVQVQMTVSSTYHSGSVYLYFGRATATAGGTARTFDAAVSSFWSLGAAPGEVLSYTSNVPTVSSILRKRSARLMLDYIDPLTSPQTAPHPFFAAVLHLRGALSNAAAGLSGGEEAGVLAALLSGDRSMISADVRNSLQKSGLSHLVVVSGLHLSMLAQLIAALLAPLRRRRLESLLSIGFCWGFALLTGLGDSVVRAAVMLSLAQIAGLIGRRGDSLTSLASAGMLMALFNPTSVVSAAFLLSYGSVLGIAALGGPIERTLKALPGRMGTALRWAGGPLAVTISAQLGAAPALLALYGTIPVLGVFTNLLAVGLVEPIMLLGLPALLLNPIFPLAGLVLGRMCTLLIWMLLALARAVAALPFSQVGLTERYQAVWLAGFFLLLIALCAWRPSFKLVTRSLLSMLAVLLTASCLSLALRRNTIEAVLFPTQAAVIRGSRGVLLGAPENGAQAQDVTQALIRLGVRKLDCIVLDDSVGATAATATVAEAFGCTNLAAPDTPAVRSFCHAAGLTLVSIENPATLLGGVPLDFEKTHFLLTFADGSVYQSDDGYAIINANSPPLFSIGEKIVRYRFQLGGTS